MRLIFAIGFSSSNDKFSILVQHRNKKIKTVLVFIHMVQLLLAAPCFFEKFLVTDHLVIKTKITQSIV